MTRVVYDIEVWNRLNFIGFGLDNGKKFWLVNWPDHTPQIMFAAGNPIYINQPAATDFARKVFREQKYGVPFGFNNHGYDDYLVDDIAAALDPFFIRGKSDAIISTRPRQFFDWESYDTREQMPQGFSLKKWEAQSGLPVDESSIPFDYAGDFTETMLYEALQYNAYDLDATQALAEARGDYFSGKELLVQEYGYPGARRYSNGSVSARYLMGNEKLFDFKPDTPKISGVPDVAADFLHDALKNSPYISQGKTEAEKKARSAGLTLQTFTEEFGNVISWGWGGLHSARGHLHTTPRGSKKPVYDHATYKNVEQWDVESMFPSIIIRDNLLGKSTAKYTKLVAERLKNKAAGLQLAATQKIVVNAVYGLLRLNGSRLFNPWSAIAVNVAGMVAVYNLAKRLAKYGTIVQVNTDGVAFVPDANVSRETLDTLRAEWETEYRLRLELKHFTSLTQRDVNNYVAVQANGNTKVKGAALNRSLKNDLTKNTTPRVIQVAVLNALLHDTPVADTIKAATDPLDFCFTLAAVKGKIQTGYTLDVTGVPKRLKNRVNRIYAATDGHTLLKEKTKAPDGSLRAPVKFSDAPELMGVANDKLDREHLFNNIDYDYYTALATAKLAQWR